MPVPIVAEPREAQLQDAEYALPYHYADLFTPRRTVEPTSRFEMVEEGLGLPPGSRLLDVGCGDGRFCYHAKERYAVTGVDLSPQALRWARLLNPEVAFYEGFLPDLGLSGFDGAVALDVLEHVPEAQIVPMVRGLHSALREGGRLVVTVPSAAVPCSAKHYRHYNEATLRATLSPFFEAEIHGYGRRRTWARLPFTVLDAVSLVFHSHTVVRRLPGFTAAVSSAKRHLWYTRLRTGRPGACVTLIAACSRLPVPQAEDGCHSR